MWFLCFLHLFWSESCDFFHFLSLFSSSSRSSSQFNFSNQFCYIINVSSWLFALDETVTWCIRIYSFIKWSLNVITWWKCVIFECVFSVWFWERKIKKSIRFLGCQKILMQMCWKRFMAKCMYWPQKKCKSKIIVNCSLQMRSIYLFPVCTIKLNYNMLIKKAAWSECNYIYRRRVLTSKNARKFDRLLIYFDLLDEFNLVS